MRARVVSARDVPAERRDGDTAEVRLTLAAEDGSGKLEQRVIRFGRGLSNAYGLDGVQGLLYVVSGEGVVRVGGEEHRLDPRAGAYFVPGERFAVDNESAEDLVTVLVTAPAPRGVTPSPAPRVVRYDERPSFPAGKDREFRYLVHRDTGCPDITQFVGTIPPGRAPNHSHVYDEVIYVLEGTGTLHVEGRTFPIEPGTCMHLPPLLEHALENDGDNPMYVLGVFHPSGDPASRAYEANE
jgi:mannose-6-phosphate isomerase-like protein (cupin superfamily)